MVFALLADAVFVVHVGFVLFVLAGGRLVRRWPRLLMPHLGAAAWGVFVAASGGVCPLTPLENWLLVRAGRDGYPGGFLERLLAPLLYPDALTRQTQWAEALLVVAVNLAAYRRLLRRRPPARD